MTIFFFRGNHQRSLKRLGLTIDSRIVNIISQNNISFDNLVQVELDVRGVPDVGKETTPVVVAIARNAKSFVFSASQQLPIPTTEIITEFGQQIQRIQFLELNIQHIQFQSIKTLLKSLPQLHTLQVYTIVASVYPQLTSFTDFASTLDLRSEIWNNNFSHLGFRYGAKLSTPYPAEDLLMLAITCPNISKLTSLNDRMGKAKRLKEQFKSLLKSKKFPAEKYGNLKDTLQIYTIN